MTSCNYHHEQIIHDERTCPLCDAKDEISRLEDRVADLERELSDTGNELTDAQREIDELRNERRVA